MLPISPVYDEAEIMAFMDIQPVNPGHVLVIPKQHIPSLAGLDDRTSERLIAAARKVAEAIRLSPLRCEGINLFLADGEAAGQEVFHTHLHVFPRFKDDGFGLRFPERYHTLPSRAELDDTASQIRLKLKRD
jgi:histidine triad (HIT) family protein